MVAKKDDENKRRNGPMPLPLWVVGLIALGVVAVLATQPIFVPAAAPAAAAPEMPPVAQVRMDPVEAAVSRAAAAPPPPPPPPPPLPPPPAPPKVVVAPPVASAAKKPAAPGKRSATFADPSYKTALTPLWGLKHVPTNDFVMALGFGYTTREFARFISTLRGTKFAGDIAVAAGPEAKMRKGVPEYLRGERVLAYPFTYACTKKGGRRLLMTPSGCTLTNWYAAEDKRTPRPLALSRYEMYRTWIQMYEPSSWGIIFDFRDTYFQLDPFVAVDRSAAAPNLLLFAENRLVKTVGNCVFNSGWLRCWGKDVPKKFANNSVVCSGSTMGSAEALMAYTERMIAEFDTMKCHMTPARTESDQGYHNYLYDSGALAKLPGVRVKHFEQGHGLVNTIGAMNGFRVPKHMKGPLDTHWKIRDPEGYLLDYDGQKSAVVHQWDRFHAELVRFIDTLVDAYHRDNNKKLP